MTAPAPPSGRIATTPSPRSAASGRISRSASRWRGLYGTWIAWIRPVCMTRASSSKARRLVVGRPDEVDVPVVLLPLEPRQALLPCDEIVVFLLELDVPAVEGELVG